MSTAEAVPSRSRPTDLAARRFPMALRGYNPEDVRRFLAAVEEQMARLEGQVEWLRARSEHFERRTASATEAAYRRVAHDLVGLVRKAELVAQQVRASAEEEARQVVDSAHTEARRVLMQARRDAQGILAAGPAGSLSQNGGVHRSPAETQRWDAGGDLPSGLDLDIDIKLPSIEFDAPRSGP